MSSVLGSTGWNRWKLLWVVVLAGPVMACKSTGSMKTSEPARGSLECPAQLLLPQTSVTYTVTCEGFSPPIQRLKAGAEVKFVSACEDSVTISFSDPNTLFTTGVETIVLGPREEKTKFVSNTPGCHQMCFHSLTCPSEDRDSKTGSLDVYTSGGPGPEPLKPTGS